MEALTFLKVVKFATYIQVYKKCFTLGAKWIHLRGQDLMEEVRTEECKEVIFMVRRINVSLFLRQLAVGSSMQLVQSSKPCPQVAHLLHRFTDYALDVSLTWSQMHYIACTCVKQAK